MRLVTVSEAAYALSCTRRMIVNAISEGKMKTISLTTNGKRFVALWDYLVENGLEPKPYFDALDARKKARSLSLKENKKG